MIEAGSLELAHARIWARWGARPDEATWHRIEITRDLGAVLEIAHAGPLARWIEGIGPGAGVHDIEAALRRHWRERVAELAGWMPPAWRQAIDWCAVLVDLPLLQHLARGGAPPSWAADDAGLQPLLEREPTQPAQPRIALLASARADPQHVLALWSAHWRDCLPRAAAGRQAIERQLVPLLARHAQAFGAPQTVDGWSLRRTLQARLVALLRRALVEPVAAFAYLALEALELERLRAELVGRAAFPQRTATP
jgi:hypothetical protein